LYTVFRNTEVNSLVNDPSKYLLLDIRNSGTFQDIWYRSSPPIQSDTSIVDFTTWQSAVVVDNQQRQRAEAFTHASQTLTMLWVRGSGSRHVLLQPCTVLVKTAVAVQVAFNLKSVTDLRDSSGRSWEAPTDVNGGYPADVVHLHSTKLQTHCRGGRVCAYVSRHLVRRHRGGR